MVPGLLVSNSFPMLQLVWGNRRLGRLVFACALLALFVPLVLEALGVLPPSYEWRDGAMVILPRMLVLTSTTSVVVLLAGGLIMVTSNNLLIADAVRQQISSRRAALSQAFVLRDLLPDALRAVAPKRAEPGALEGSDG